jgi:catechol 2,3-dioxygenase-like lactoylglutathione lyase family enzyme
MSNGAPAIGWGHVNVNVADLERSIAFYELLGFSVFLPGIPYFGLARDEAAALTDAHAEVLGLPAGTHGRACIMQFDDGFPKLDLTEFELPSPAAPLVNGDRGFVRICLACGDLAAEYARLTAAGVEFLTEPRVGTGEIADVAVCRDPDGALIELIQLFPERIAALGVDI